MKSIPSETYSLLSNEDLLNQTRKRSSAIPPKIFENISIMENNAAEIISQHQASILEAYGNKVNNDVKRIKSEEVAKSIEEVTKRIKRISKNSGSFNFINKY